MTRIQSNANLLGGTPIMKLIYRGVNYELTTSGLEVPKRVMVGKYRGLPVRFTAPARTALTGVNEHV